MDVPGSGIRITISSTPLGNTIPIQRFANGESPGHGVSSKTGWELSNNKFKNYFYHIAKMAKHYICIGFLRFQEADFLGLQESSAGNARLVYPSW